MKLRASILLSALAFSVLPINAASASVLTCAEGGVCVVGDTGPGGGKVFFVKPTGSFLESVTGVIMMMPMNYELYLSTAEVSALNFEYLEIAPTGADSSSGGGLEWSSIDGPITGGTSASFGAGAANTRNIVSSFPSDSPSNYAAAFADQYINNGKDDWFLPSSDEFYLAGIVALQFSSRGGSLGVQDGYYVTSVTATDSAGGAVYLSDSFYRYVSTVAINRRQQRFSVRPIRSFSRIQASIGVSDSAALAAQRARDAEREAARQVALRELTRTISISNQPTFEQFQAAEIRGVTAKNFSEVTKALGALPEKDRSDIATINKVALKYSHLDEIAKGGRFPTIAAHQLTASGVIPAENRTLIAMALRKLPVDQRDTYAKIDAAVKAKAEALKARKVRLAAVIARNQNRYLK